MTDAANCGGCNVTCSFPFATASCMNGVCTQGACLPGFYDRNPNVAGCETACEKSTAASRSATASTTTATASSTTARWPARSPAKHRRLRGRARRRAWARPAGSASTRATYQDVEDMTGLRRPRQRLRRPDRRAVPDRQGLHRRLGRLRESERRLGLRQHHAGQHRCNGSPKTPGIEICNGLDDDCDGKVDELDSASNDERRQADLPRRARTSRCSRTRRPATTRRHQLRLRLDPPALLGRGPPALVERDQGRGRGGVREDRQRLAPLHRGRVAGRLQRRGQHDLPLRQHLRRADLQRLGLHQGRRA